jgi:AraC-like DNA-binding protein
MSDTVSNSGHTSYIGTVITAARALDAYGLDGTATLVEAGIDVNATPAFDARVPTGLLHNALLAHARDKLDPLFALKFADLVFPASYHAFGVMLTSATTMRAFCQRLTRYYGYVNTGDKLEFDEDSGILSYRQMAIPGLAENPFEVVLHDAGWAATMVKMARMVSHPDYAPRKISFGFPAPAEEFVSSYVAWFRCPIDYDAPLTAIHFAADRLDDRLPGGNAELARHSEVLVYDYLKSFVEFDTVNCARMALFELLPRGDFSLESLAASLALSADEITAGLKALGTSYQQLLGDTRRELSEEYIERADLTINEIAYMLGFSDCSNFARSFRRWTGMSPTDYREKPHRS